MSFWAEMGDKSQLLAMAYATRYRLRVVWPGLLLGTVSVLFLPALIGGGLSAWIPRGWMSVLAAVGFLGFGLWTCFGEETQKDVQISVRFPVLLIASTLFLTEFGDKTMLATFTLAATQPWVPVWFGCALGMFSADMLAVAVGRVLHRHLPEHRLRWIAALLFFGFAFWNAWKAWQIFRVTSSI